MKGKEKNKNKDAEWRERIRQKRKEQLRGNWIAAWGVSRTNDTEGTLTYGEVHENKK